MAPLSISVIGDATFFRRAERALLTVSVECSESSSQKEASENVTKTSNELRTILKDMALKDASGDAASDAPITHWSMKSFSSSSHVPHDNQHKPLPRVYKATAIFNVKFRDFSELGSFATMLSTMEYISITKVEWQLTAATKASLGTQIREEAVKVGMQRAKDYAGALGLKEVRATEVYDGRGGPHYPSTYDRGYGHGMPQSYGGNAGAGDLNFQPEDVQLVCSITVKCSAE